MNWTDEEIDDLFRDAAQKIVVPPYQDAFFEEFEKMLPKKKKRRLGLWFILCTTGIFGMGAGIYYNYGKLATENKAVATLTALSGEKHNKSVINTADNTTSFSNQQGDENTEEMQNPATMKDNTDDGRQTYRGKRKTNTRLQNTPYQGVGGGEMETSKQMEPENAPAPRPVYPAIRLQGKQLTSPAFPIESGAISPLNLLYKRDKGPNSLYLELGAAAMESYLIPNQGSTEAMKAISFEAGYQRKLRNLVFGAGLRYTHIYVGQLELTRASKVYGFKLDYYSQNMDYKTISSFELPLQVSYVKGIHRIGFAATPTFNAGAKIEFTKIKNGEMTDQSTLLFNKTGMRSFGFKPEISYQVLLPFNLELGINVGIQTVNPLQKDKFAGQLNSNPFTGQLHIRKNIGLK